MVVTCTVDGHLETVQYLSLTRFEGCTTDAMDKAAANGHLDVIQWLHDHRDEGCTTGAFDNAAANGHLEVLKWLVFTRRREGGTSRALDLAAANGQLHVVHWLADHFQFIPSCLAYDGAAGAGHLDVLQYMLSKHDNLMSVATVELAARYVLCCCDTVCFTDVVV